MKLVLPNSLAKFSHDDIVKILMELNPRFFRPNRASWPQGIPDLEDATREVVEVALTSLRDAWVQCLYYYRSGATHIHLVLSPRHFLDYQTKEAVFIKSNPIPNVEVHALPELKIKSYLLPKKPKLASVHIPQLGFILTEEDCEKSLKLNQMKEKTKNEQVIEQSIELIPVEIDDNTDLEKLKYTPKALKQIFTNKHCADCNKFKIKDNIGTCTKPGYKWQIALDLAARDAVCQML